MGKTHKALKRAEDQYRERQVRISREVLYKEPGSNKGRASARKNTKQYEDLKKKLLIRNISGSTKTVLFVKTFNGSESKNHAIKFATLLAEDSRLKVLLVDLNTGSLDLQEVFEFDQAIFLSDLFSYKNKTDSLKKVGPGNLYKTRWGRNHSGLEDTIKSGKFDQFLKITCEKFDYLILNVPESAGFQECRFLCSKLDAVALIVKSDKIAGRITLNGNRHFQNSADKLLGLVVDDTRSYRQKFMKKVSVVMAGCLIFTVGFLIGKYLVQLNHHEITMSIGEQVHESSKPMPASNKIQQEKPAMTSEIASFTESALEAGQTRVNDHKRKNESDSNEVNQPMRDGIKTAGLTVEKEIEKPVLSRDNGSEGKRKAESRQGKVVVVQKGDTLFRIIYKAYGTYNAKIVNLVLKENPKIINSTHIVAGQVIKLPEIN